MHINTKLSKRETSSPQTQTKTSSVSTGFTFLKVIDLLVGCLWREGPPRSKLYGFLSDSDATYVSMCAPFLKPIRVSYEKLDDTDPVIPGSRIEDFPEPTPLMLALGCYCIGAPIVLQILQYLHGWFETLFDYSDSVAGLIDYDTFEQLYNVMDVGLENFVPLAKYFTVYPMAKYFQNPLPAKPAFYLGGPLMFTGKLKRFMKSRIVSYNKSSAKLCWTILQGVKRATEIVPPEYVAGSLRKHRKGMEVDLTGQFDWAFMDNFDRKMRAITKGFQTRTELFEASNHASYENKKSLGGQRAHVIDKIGDHGERMNKMIETRVGVIEEVRRQEHVPVFSEIKNLTKEVRIPLMEAALATIETDDERWDAKGLPHINQFKVHKLQSHSDVVPSDEARRTAELLDYEHTEDFKNLLAEAITFLDEIQVRKTNSKRASSRPLWVEESFDFDSETRISQNHDALVWWKEKWNAMTYIERMVQTKKILRHESNELDLEKIVNFCASKHEKRVLHQDKKTKSLPLEEQGVILDIPESELINRFAKNQAMKDEYTSLKGKIAEYEAEQIPNLVGQSLRFRDLPVRKLLSVKVKPVLEPLKVRLITVGESVPYYMSKFFQKSMHSFLRTKPQFQLIGKPLTPQILQWLDTASKSIESKANVKFTFWVSGDYSAATDGLRADYTKAAFESFLDRTKLSHSIKEQLRLVIYGQVCEYPKGKKNGALPPVLQTNGQLMGSPLSFPILCVVNLVTYWISMEEYLHTLGSDFDLTVDLLAALINGDDILFRSNPMHYQIWQNTIKEVGFELSPGKNYCHKEYLTVNSELYKVKEVGGVCTFEKIDYFNIGLLKGQSKLNSTSEKTRPRPIWSTYDIVLKGAVNKVRAHSRFLFHNREAISLATNDGEYNLFAHQLLGGLGCNLPEGISPNFTNFQLKLASFLREKALKPCIGRNIRTSRFYKGIVSKSTRLTEPMVSKFRRIETLVGEGPLEEGKQIFCDPSASEDILTRQYEFDSPVFHVGQISAPLMKQFRKAKNLPQMTPQEVMIFPARFIEHGIKYNDEGAIVLTSSQKPEPFQFSGQFDLSEYEE